MQSMKSPCTPTHIAIKAVSLSCEPFPMQQQAMKSLILLLCLALVANADIAVNPTAEHLRTLTTLLQEHHRFTRQAATPPFTETVAPTTTPTPTDGSEVSSTTAPSGLSSPNFNQPACQNAFGIMAQSCFVAHGLSIEDLTGSNNNNDDLLSIYAQLIRIICSDGRCQSDLLKYYEACFGSMVRWRM